MEFKAKIILSLFVSILGSTGCSDSFLESDQPDTVLDNTPQLDVEAVSRAFSELTFETGDNDFELNVLFNQKWVFRMTVPEIENNELLPLFVNMHGGALNPSPKNHQKGDCMIGPSLEETNMKAYILSPNSQGLLWFDLFNEAQVVNLVKFAIEHLNVDPKKVVAFGISDGGFGSWFFADAHPELFSAAIPIAQAYGLMTTDEGIKRTEIPLYVIHGERDELYPFTNTETLVEQSRNAGSEITLVKAIGLDHSFACFYQPYVKDAIEWLKNSVWE